jgi:glutamine cyclotransferase
MIPRICLHFLLVLFLLGASSAHSRNKEKIMPPKQLNYVLVQQYPHDPRAFTQGLAWNEGQVYEGTGLYGHSSLRRVDLKTGLVHRQRNYTRKYFGEGITVFQGKIYQLTWKNNKVFLFDKKDFSLLRTWSYSREGWGITHNGKELITSDGTAQLCFLDPESLQEKRRILVQDDQGPVDRLNELEYVRGTIYANVWMTNRIALIRHQDGIVLAWLDLSRLAQQVQSIWKGKADVLNGIMYDPKNDRLFVTGKLWPALFEIKVVDD